jgi:hypothetical protein
MNNSGIVHIVIAPPVAPDENLIKSAADTLDNNLYDTRLLLSGEIPRIAAHYESIQTAEPVLHALVDLGIKAIALSDSILRQPPLSFMAYMLKFGKQEVLFKDRNDIEKRIRDNEAFLIITGMIQTSTESETITTRKKLNVTTTLITGGIPIYRKVKEKTITRSQGTEYFIRLYSKKPEDPFVVISQHDMDYSFLGEKTAMTTRENFASVVSAMQQAFPQAIFNDSLSKPFTITSSPNRTSEDVEIHCRLIYVFNLVKSGLYQAIS